MMHLLRKILSDDLQYTVELITVGLKIGQAVGC